MIERTGRPLDLVGSKWVVEILFLMASGIRRCARLVDNVPGLSKEMLTAALRKLERDAIVVRHVFVEIPVRIEYTLTPSAGNSSSSLWRSANGPSRMRASWRPSSS
jgi:DNA-binding HxlR family transcriptional regulator